MSFKQVADLLDVPVAQLQLLNPSYKLNIIPLQRQESLFEITDGKIAAFVSNEDKMYACNMNLILRKTLPKFKSGSEK
jgi:membrane-bound lytic murein transglycosylase D